MAERQAPHEDAVPGIPAKGCPRNAAALSFAAPARCAPGNARQQLQVGSPSVEGSPLRSHQLGFPRPSRGRCLRGARSSARPNPRMRRLGGGAASIWWRLRAVLHPYAFLICRMGVRILTSSDRPVHVPPQTR
jgi:hypothetical protein